MRSTFSGSPAPAKRATSTLIPVNSDVMNTITTIQICVATPIAALPTNPTYCPTITWSMIPWMPPMMFWSMLGHAIFHTAGSSGPSTMERS